MNNIYELLAFSFGAGACWFVWFYCMKEQRVDIYREELFALRKDLFLLAACGSIPFDDYSYVGLRSLLNGMLQYAHRITLPTSLVVRKVLALDPNPLNHYQRWQESLSEQPPEVRKALELIHIKMFRAYMNHLVRGSIVLFTVHLFLLVRGAISAIFLSTLRSVKPSLDITDEAFNRIANSFDAKALEERAYRDQTDARHALSL